MPSPHALSVLVDERQDTPTVAAIAARAGFTLVWTSAERARGMPDIVGVFCEAGTSPGVAGGRPGWIRGPWSALARATAQRWLAAGLEVSADADESSARDIRATGATPVLALPSLDAMVRAALGLGATATSRRLAALVGMSPGRTAAEANARLRVDPVFARRATVTHTIVGTLELCLEGIASLLRTGVTDVRISLPATPDFPDVLAQVAALGGEALIAAEPGAPRSPPPPPPTEWGGRP